jgi:hypothetical protein
MRLLLPFRRARRTEESKATLALGDANRLLGKCGAAEESYRKALSLDSNLVGAHIGLASLRLTGALYYEWLDWFHSALAPATVIEIGVNDGASLARARPPSVVIGVDPSPTIVHQLRAETHIFPETSDQFFTRRGPDALLAGRTLGIAFIDGLHLYEQALRDFINIERYCGTHSVILVHDTIPLDEATQDRRRKTQFHTGDVWKIVPCIKHYRPDLDIFTIATPWSGLTVVTGLRATSSTLADAYDDAVARFINLPFSEVEKDREAMLNIVPNDQALVETRLKARGIPLRQ